MNIRTLSLGLTAALAIGFAIPQAQAGVLLEPYLGYHMGKIKQSTTEMDSSGIAMGGRIGYAQMGLGGGLDVMQGTWTAKKNSVKYDTAPSDLGIFVAYTFPVMIRAYAGYNFQSNTSLKDTSGTTKLKGSGMKLGVGLTTLPFVAINLEYRTSTYTKDSDGNTLANSLKEDTYGLVVSLPLDL